MKYTLIFILALELVLAQAVAGTIFDENGNKIGTCKGSTCVLDGNEGGNDGQVPAGWVGDFSPTVKSTATGTGGTGMGGAGGGGGAGGAGGQASAYVKSSSSYNDYTPPSAAYAAPPTSPCIVTHGVGASVPGFSGSVTTGAVNETCVTLEVARQAAIFGDADARKLANELYKQELRKRLDEQKQPAPASSRTASPGDWNFMIDGNG